MTTYSAKDILGKTLYAKRRVQLKAMPLDSAPIVRTVVPGAAVGRVYSYLEPAEGRKALHWMFETKNGFEYAPHNSKDFDTDQLQTQFEAETEGNWYDGILPSSDSTADPLGVGQFGKQLTVALALIALTALVVTVVPRVFPKK